MNVVAELKTAWDTPGLHRGTLSRRTYRTIANSPEDQTCTPGTSNPLWDAVRWMPASPPLFGSGRLEPESPFLAFPTAWATRLAELGADRNALCTRYAWSIITPGDVDWMLTQLSGRAVVEIGAGSGYWAWQLEQAGVDVAAYDPHPVADDNKFCTAGPYTTVLQDGPTAVKHHQDRALLMVWPPYGGEHARHALSLYEGDLLIYAGEGHGGCTADDDFYDLLGSEWEEASISPHHVTWSGIHCQLAAYRRK